MPFCSLAVDFHVTQTVNGEKGVHGMLPQGLAVLATWLCHCELPTAFVVPA